MERLTGDLSRELTALRDEESQRGQAAVDRLAALEATVANHLTTLGTALEAPMTRLIEVASETPKAAAEVIGRLRKEISNNIERDNQLLEERSRLMEQLNGVSDSLAQSSAGQMAAMQALVESSTETLRRTGEQFAGQVASEVSQVSQIADHFSAGAAEIASLGEAFKVAVALYNDSNGKLVTSLERIESALEQSNARSDEQLGYYVAQAREVIDYSVSAQREIFDEIRQIGHATAGAAQAAAEVN